jgi:hypothetical protein
LVPHTLLEAILDRIDASVAEGLGEPRGDQIVFGLHVVIKAHRSHFELLRHAAHRHRFDGGADISARAADRFCMMGLDFEGGDQTVNATRAADGFNRGSLQPWIEAAGAR